jgi:hypothetical protein
MLIVDLIVIVGVESVAVVTILVDAKMCRKNPIFG